MKHYIFDVESNGLLDTLDKIHCIVIYDIQNKKTFSYRPGDIDKAITKLEEADLLIGHNIVGFDIPAIKKVYPNFKTPLHF